MGPPEITAFGASCLVNDSKFRYPLLLISSPHLAVCFQWTYSKLLYGIHLFNNIVNVHKYMQVYKNKEIF
jgi:hypothetical protein